MKRMKCYVCQTNSHKNICGTCMANPFRVEDYRQILVAQKKMKLLQQTYTPHYSEIMNLNTANFWDEKLFDIKSVQNSDNMTRDRIRTAIKFLPQHAKRVLDIGAGYGYLEEVLAERKNLSIYANDISSNAIKNLKKRFRGEYIVQSLYNLKYNNNFFDAIYILEVLEHIPPSKTLAVLKDIRKLLNKNGVLILSVPMNEGLEAMTSNPNGHIRNYTESLIKAELMLSKFRIIDSKKFYAFKNYYFIKKIMAKILRNRWKHNNIIIKAQPF